MKMFPDYDANLPRINVLNVAYSTRNCEAVMDEEAKAQVAGREPDYESVLAGYSSHVLQR
jgi:hypothetical protein